MSGEKEDLLGYSAADRPSLADAPSTPRHVSDQKASKSPDKDGPIATLVIGVGAAMPLCNKPFRRRRLKLVPATHANQPHRTASW